MSLTVKLLYREEVRRLTLVPPSLTYTALRQEISKVILNSNFSLKYLDEEGDQISLCSDLEFSEALRQLDEKKEKLLKIYVSDDTPNFVTPITPKKTTSIPVIEPINVKTTQPPTQTQQPHSSFSNSENLTHKNINCSSCKIEIIGTRWKCSICPELNLCELCEPWDNHNPGHPLLRMKLPITPSLNAAYMTFSNFQQFGEQVNRFLTTPQGSEFATQAKKLGEEVIESLKTVTDQVLSQSKELSQELSTVVAKEATSFVEMCNSLNEELTKTCRYSSAPRQQQQVPRAQARQTRVPQPTNVRPPSAAQVRTQPAPVQPVPVKPAPVQPVPAQPVPAQSAPSPAPRAGVLPRPATYEYASERLALRQMGFSDEDLNSELLMIFRGDLNECINSLCQLSL